jgi:hypothetical protein
LAETNDASLVADNSLVLITQHMRIVSPRANAPSFSCFVLGNDLLFLQKAEQRSADVALLAAAVALVNPQSPSNISVGQSLRIRSQQIQNRTLQLGDGVLCSHI